MWRPEGWNNPYGGEFTLPDRHGGRTGPMIFEDSVKFEEGADAMLEALKQAGVYMKAGEPVTQKLAGGNLKITLNKNGWLTIIPEEPCGS